MPRKPAQPTFTPEQLAQIPDLTPAEARRLLQETRGGEGIVEDGAERDPVAAILSQQREAKWQSAVDSGSEFRAQAEEMKAYFATCLRYPFTHHEERALRVEINGYVFWIPPDKEHQLPLEVIEVIENKARVERQNRLLSAVLQARANKPVHEAQDVAVLAGAG